MLNNRKILAIIVSVILIIALPLFIFLVQRTQENRSRASVGTTYTLSLVPTPNKPTLSVDDQIQVVLKVSPANGNIISVVKFEITYDKTKVEPASTPFSFSVPNNPAVDPNGPTPLPPVQLQSWRAVAPVRVDSTRGVITGTYSVGSDPTQALQKETNFGTFSFKALAGTEGQNTTIGFAQSTTAAYSLASTDSAQENVLSNASPVQFAIASSAVPTLVPACNSICTSNADCAGGQSGCTVCNSGGKCAPPPTPSGQACLAVITYAVNDTTNECKQYGSSCIPSGWHTVDACPTTTPTTTPTGSQTVKIQGHIVDANGNDLTLSGAQIKIYKIDANDPSIAVLYTTLQSSPAWSIDTLPRANYKVVASPPAGTNYTITSNICNDCNFHPNYSNGALVQINFAQNPQSNYSDIYYKFTSSTTPSITQVPDFVALDVNIALHGIGYAGDNAGPGRQVAFSATNPKPANAPKNPLHLTREASVQFYDAQNQLIYSVPTTLTFDPNTYTFRNSIGFYTDARAIVADKPVSIRIQIPKYLSVVYPLITLPNRQTTVLPYKALIAANIYNDAENTNQLDILDYNAIMDCREDVDDSNKSGSCIVDADVNDDGLINVLDYQLLIRELSVQTGL